MRARWFSVLALLAGCGGQSVHRGERNHTPVVLPGAGGQGGASVATGGESGHTSGDGEAAGEPAACTRELNGDVRLERQEDVQALRGVSRLDGDLFVTGDVSDLADLSCLTYVSGDLHVSEARKLETLAGLENVRALGGVLYVGWGCDWDDGDCIGNPALRSVDALAGLTTAGGVYITATCRGSADDGPCAVNAVLERAVFAELAQTSTIWVFDNPALTEVRLDAVPSLAGFNLTGNSALTAASFGALASVEDFFYVGDNPELSRLPDFSRLARVPAGIDIVRSHFTSLEGLDALTSTTQIYLNDDPELAELSSLAHLSELTYLSVSKTGLEDLRGLEGVVSFGVLSLTENPKLETLSGLEHLVNLNELELEDNASLSSLHALAALKSVRGDGFSITDNPKLPTCEAEWLRDHVGVDNIGGATNIAGNDDTAGCGP
jgi:hypothetical protein